MTKSAELTELLAPVVGDLGYEFVGLEYLPQGKHSLLRIYIDRDGGVNVDDCEQVSREVSALLDVHDPIRGAYTLELSSPGLDRPLFTPEHFERFSGHRVKLRLAHPLDGRRKFDGRLLGIDDDFVLLEEQGECLRLPFGEIARANLVPDIHFN